MSNYDLTNGMIKSALKSTYRNTVRIANLYKRREKIAMFHPGRCGSTVLGNMLNEHSNIYWAGEIFQPLMNKNLETTGNRLVHQKLNISENRKVSKLFGFETKYLSFQHLNNNCINLPLEEYISTLIEHRYSRFIVLHRDNYLRRVISGIVGRLKNEWHSTLKLKKPQKIRIDLDSVPIGSRYLSLLDLFKYMDDEYRRITDHLSKTRTLHLTYEKDILQDPRIAYEKTCIFLGLSAESPAISLRRTNPFSYTEMVSNFKDVKLALTGTDYEWMLND